MWLRHQNLDADRLDKAGTRWHFRVWHHTVNGANIERVFFWDDNRDSTGVVHVSPAIHVRQLHDLIEKLVSDAALRQRNARELRFPIERHYSEYEPFPEAN